MSEVNGFQPPEESSFQAPEASASQEGGSSTGVFSSFKQTAENAQAAALSAAADRDQQQTSVVEAAREDSWQTKTEAKYSRAEASVAIQGVGEALKIAARSVKEALAASIQSGKEKLALNRAEAAKKRQEFFAPLRQKMEAAKQIILNAPEDAKAAFQEISARVQAAEISLREKAIQAAEIANLRVDNLKAQTDKAYTGLREKYQGQTYELSITRQQSLENRVLDTDAALSQAEETLGQYQEALTRKRENIDSKIGPRARAAEEKTIRGYQKDVDIAQRRLDRLAARSERGKLRLENLNQTNAQKMESHQTTASRLTNLENRLQTNRAAIAEKRGVNAAT